MVTSDQSRVVAAPDSWADPTITVARGSRWRRVLPLVLWMTCLVVAVVLLRALGGGRLAAPPLTDPGSWGTWASGRDPLEAVMVVLRLLALGLAWYLAGATSISVIARLLRAARLVRIADALSVGPVKVLVQQAVGIGLAASVLATVVPAGPGAVRSHADAPGDPAEVGLAVLVPMPFGVDDPEVGKDAAGSSASVALTVQQPTPTGGREEIVPVPAPAPTPLVTVRPGQDASVDAPTRASERASGGASERAPERASERASGGASERAPERAPAAASPTPAPAGNAEDTTASERAASSLREVRVEPGDHFWAIAEADVARHLGRPGTDHEVIAHWQAILEANADRLPVAGNPDVLLPGQMVLLPRVTEVHT